ncbi:ligase-associated DNA damage response endonuclease PdeM [Rhizosaccharibacter radicis]|uniref:Ligase-associated DNA damage response endonuclease PdeM n=1 Tax=Rhizosaccharibacter radicis TaxID=2782605 RepID=A0ABT1VTZ3_9PROT|nr:ligase-associated DNA damage response endonuclease PdeM [Acetobacteraceae bacterium KSS12]
MTAAPLHLAGERLMLDPSGILWWPARRLLAVADLHLEKGSAAARRGSLLPPWDSRITLDRLLDQVRRWRPEIVVALGDSFHDRLGAARLPGPEADRLRRLGSETRLVWVQGNHDPEPPEGLPGEHGTRFEMGPLLFRHEASPAEPNRGIRRQPSGPIEICGHHHPKARVATRAGSISRPCFVADNRRMILPAFGAYTGGLDVLHPAIAALFPLGGRAFLLGTGRLFSFSLAAIRQGT